ncbi:primase C-terminal domain-containing protein [Staphylococcus pseudintermedius]|nr:primase C-terminal domain-containing protein [Staphylococcus pseudintermedius]
MKDNISDKTIIPKITIQHYKNIYSNSFLCNREATFSELVNYLSDVKVSNDKFSNGVFLLGDMKDTHRSDQNVISRHALVIDIDETPTDRNIIEDIKDNFRYSYIIYSTHNSSPEAQRFRLIIPLDQPISKKYYKSALKLFESQLGLKFDEQAFDWSRGMARPTKKEENSEFIFEYQHTYFLNTDTLVAGLDKYMKENTTPYEQSNKRSSDYWLDIGFGTSSGSRNSALASITGHLCRCNVDINLMVALLTNWNAHNSPPIEQKEFERTIKSIINKEQDRRYKGGGRY